MMRQERMKARFERKRILHAILGMLKPPAFTDAELETMSQDEQDFWAVAEKTWDRQQKRRAA